MHISVVTLLPEMFDAISQYGVSSRAIENALVSLEFWNPRDFATDKHRTVDDKPFGGGPGMLMRTEPLVESIRRARASLVEKRVEKRAKRAEKTDIEREGKEDREDLKKPLTVYLSPQGALLNHTKVLELAQKSELVLVCGRYQGVDSRVIESEIDEEVSLGDFVLSGGELAAMALIDAMLRFQPGALGDAESARSDSLAKGLLHNPQYTRPQEFEGKTVPQTLLSGDHAAIEQWRLKQSLGTTWLKRPDLLKKLTLDKEQEELLDQFKSEYQAKS